MGQKRIIWLDIARGLAMFCVIYGHVLPRNAGPGKWMYSWHIPIFFLITAILLSMKDDWQQMTYRELIIKDSKSILYPYFVFNMIDVTIMCFTSSVKAALNGVLHFCLFDGLQALWFLSALFISRQLFFQLMKRTTKKEVIWAFVVTVLLITSTFSAVKSWFDSQGGIYKSLYMLANIGNRSLIGLVFMIIGYTATNFLRSIRLSYLTKGVTLFFTLILSVSLFDYNSVDFHFSLIGNPLLFYSLAIAGSVFIFILSDILSHFRLSGIIRFMGSNSIVFLITHLPVRQVLAFLFPSIDNKHKVVFFLMLVVVEYCVVWLVIRYLPFLYKLPRKQVNRKVGQADKV